MIERGPSPERDLLDPEIIEEAMTRAIAQAQNGEADSERERERIENDLHIVKSELDRLAAAVLVAQMSRR